MLNIYQSFTCSLFVGRYIPHYASLVTIISFYSDSSRRAAVTFNRSDNSSRIIVANYNTYMIGTRASVVPVEHNHIARLRFIIASSLAPSTFALRPLNQSGSIVYIRAIAKVHNAIFSQDASSKSGAPRLRLTI